MFSANEKPLTTSRARERVRGSGSRRGEIRVAHCRSTGTVDALREGSMIVLFGSNRWNGGLLSGHWSLQHDEH